MTNRMVVALLVCWLLIAIGTGIASFFHVLAPTTHAVQPE